MLISRKPVQRRGLGEKYDFFRYSPAVIKGLMKVTNLFQIDLFPHKKKSQICQFQHETGL